MFSTHTTTKINTTETMETVIITFIVIGVLILVLGTVSNSLSLTHFINTRRNRETTLSRLFILLNIFDLQVCVFGICNSLTNLWPKESSRMAYYVTLGIMLLSVQFTWFSTCLLAVTRAIKVVSPFYNINWNVMNVAVAVYGLIALASGVLQVIDPFIPNDVEDIVEIVEFFLLATMYVMILVSNMVCLASLYCAKSESNLIRQATITVILISISFFILNTCYLLRYGIDAFKIDYHFLDFSYSSLIFERVFLLSNSAINPVIYFLRNGEMRVWISGNIRNVIQFCMRKIATGEEVEEGRQRTQVEKV